MFDDEKPSSAANGKSKSAKGAPKPRKQRGRTVNRRRARFIRKMALKLAKAREACLPTAEIEHAIKLSQDAQVRHTSKLKK